MSTGPNDTLDLSDYPPACRLSIEAACDEYAERVYKLSAENAQLRQEIDRLQELVFRLAGER